jgi:S-adenosyl methyltransferase
MNGGCWADGDGAGNVVDTRTPNVARMFDYYLGGKDNLAVDRAAAQKVLAAAPQVPRAARENRDFLTRAIQFLTEEKHIGQFIDIGPGLPTKNNVHHIAHRYDKFARVAYVDHDPVVLAHGRALLARKNPLVTVIDGDLREPGKILADPELCGLIDLGQPVGLCLTLVLHFLPDCDGPHELVARLLDQLAPGSYLVISHVTGDDKNSNIVKTVTEAYDHATAPLVIRSRNEIRRFFGDCVLIPPGVVYLTQWYHSAIAEHVLGDGGTRWAYAGVGLK